MMAFILTFIHLVLWTILVANLRFLRRERTLSLRPSPAPFVSILVPARNEADNLRRLLPSLLDQDYPAFEVIVYDDASTDATREVLRDFEQERLHVIHGGDPPPGWVGKVHALFQAARPARGTHYLFLDADTRLEGPRALCRLASRFEALPADTVLTGLTHLRGAASLLVSLVPSVVLTGLPWPLVSRLRAPALSALNGQCWMIRASDYHRYEPHAFCRNEVLEDVKIGRYLKQNGLAPALVDVQHEVSVFMYASFTEAWRGFRKNAYLLLGGTPVRFTIFAGFFLCTFALAPLFAPWLLFSIYGLKAITDWRTRFPGWVSVLAPLSFALAVALQWDSAFHHLTGRVTWKGRRVTPTATGD